MDKRKYIRLTLSERIKIETLLEENYSKISIAKKLKRARSTIINEINFWLNGPHKKYIAVMAHDLATMYYKFKGKKSKIELNKSLKIQVYRCLLTGISPELISGRFKKEYANNPHMQISYESIYRFIYQHPQGIVNKKLIQLLVRHKPFRKKSKKRDCNREKIKEGISIEQRPNSVETREEPGHLEGDLLIGSKQSSCIGSIVERKTRYTILVKLKNKKAKTVRSAFAKKLLGLPVLFRKSMTYDNGTEMSEHKELSRETGMKIYFAHPYSSWERGTNENTNGLIRRKYPKKTDFNNVSEKELMQLQDYLNNRPRKVLGYYTPNEMFQYELRVNKDYNNYDMELEMGNKFPRNLFSFLMPFMNEKN